MTPETVNDHREATHVRELAEQLQLAEARTERNRVLRMRKLSKRRMEARCRICPPAARDERANGHPAFSSEVILPTANAVVAWFDAHQRTEMHEWYRGHKHKQPFLHALDEREGTK